MFAATLVIAALVGAPAQVAAQSAAAPRSQLGMTTTDKTVDVARGARLTLDNQAGEVVVRTWDRDAVRVQARHSSREQVDVSVSDGQVRIRSARNGRWGARGSIDYELTVPAWMPVRLSGTYLFATLEGVQGEVSAETVQGDVTVKGGSGQITARSVEGVVAVSDAKGRIEARSVDGDVTITGSTGDIVADTTDGAIRITGSAATSIDASTVDGDIVFDGAVSSEGQYRFVTHDGDVYLRVPENTSATVSIRTYEGRFTSTYPVQLSGDYKRGRRVSFTLGGGAATVEIEAFDGHIRVLKPGDALPEPKPPK
jgi:DUF4097 and DUF4098 domain-containing protein YvlB